MVYCISLPETGTSVIMDEGAGFLAGGPVGFSTTPQAWGYNIWVGKHGILALCPALLLLFSRDLSRTEKSGC